jgi:hypothetical protein
MPGIAALSNLRRAVQQFVITDLPVAFDPQGLAAARRALDSSGVLLLGEMHGVRENPLLVRELLRVLELRSLALEWSEELTTAIETFLAEGTVADHPLLWSCDGADHRRASRRAPRAGRGRAAAADPVRWRHRRRLDLVPA